MIDSSFPGDFGAFAFFFIYGIVEDLIRIWHSNRQTIKPNLTLTIIGNSSDFLGYKFCTSLAI